MTALSPFSLPRTTVTAATVDYLREQIVSGALPAGEVLPEARVGQLLGVSRAPVREALTLLDREGLITFDRRGTARVCAIGPDDVRELSLMRLALEPVAARLACQRMTPELAASFRANLRDLRGAKTLPEVTRLDIAFHQLIVRASGNQRLIVAWEQLAAQFQLVMTHFHRAIEARTRAAQEATRKSHREMFEALSSEGPAANEALARRHAAAWLTDWDSAGRAHPSTEGQA